MNTQERRVAFERAYARAVLAVEDFQQATPGLSLNPEIHQNFTDGHYGDPVIVLTLEEFTRLTRHLEDR